MGSGGRQRLVFDGFVAGFGTASGIRLVVGHWPRSPFGAISDVMIEWPDGRRQLRAPTVAVARFIGETYAFDDVEVMPVEVANAPDQWRVTANDLDVRLAIGRRHALGWLLRAVPGALARTPMWATALDLPARIVMPGVRTRGTAGPDRREWYAASDHHRITAATATLSGLDLGDLRPVRPPVHFGFASTPPTPAITRVRTTIEVPPHWQP